MQSFETLEKKLEPFCGTDKVAVCSSGTAALHLALEALQLSLGSYVLVPCFTMVAVARAVTMAGHVPVFMDSESSTQPNIDATKVHDKVCDFEVEAMVAVHTYGRPVDMGRVHQFAEGYQLAVIEDLAEAHGLKPHPRTRFGCWSFYRNKVVNGEEGGAVSCLTYDELNRVKSLRSLGFTPDHDYRHTPRGNNYRMSNANSEVILRGLSLERINRGIMNDRIRVCDEVCPDEWKMPHREYPWVYDFLLPSHVIRGRVLGLVRTLNERFPTLQARPGFLPLNLQPEYTPLLQGPYHFAYGLSDRLMYLTIHPALVGEEFTGQVRAAFDYLRREVDWM